MKATNQTGSSALSKAGLALGTYANKNLKDGEPPNRMQQLATTLGTKLYTMGQRGMQNRNNANKFNVSDALINSGSNSLNNAVRKVMPRASYNTSYYRRKNNMI